MGTELSKCCGGGNNNQSDVDTESQANLIQDKKENADNTGKNWDKHIQKISFSSEYRIIDRVELLDNNRTAKSVKNGANASQYGWVIADSDPVSNGIHCWRVQCNDVQINTNNDWPQFVDTKWMTYGISEIYKYSEKSFKEKSVCVTSTHNDSYVDSSFGVNVFVNATEGDHNADIHKIINDNNSNTYELDMLLDCNQGILEFKLVYDKKSDNSIRFEHLPKHFKPGFVPHFCFEHAGTSIKLCKIPVDLYGVKYSNMWN